MLIIDNNEYDCLISNVLFIVFVFVPVFVFVFVFYKYDDERTSISDAGGALLFDG